MAEQEAKKGTPEVRSNAAGVAPLPPNTHCECGKYASAVIFHETKRLKCLHCWNGEESAGD